MFEKYKKTNFSKDWLGIAEKRKTFRSFMLERSATLVKKRNLGKTQYSIEEVLHNDFPSLHRFLFSPFFICSDAVFVAELDDEIVLAIVVYQEVTLLKLRIGEYFTVFPRGLPRTPKEFERWVSYIGYVCWSKKTIELQQRIKEEKITAMNQFTESAKVLKSLGVNTSSLLISIVDLTS